MAGISKSPMNYGTAALYVVALMEIKDENKKKVSRDDLLRIELKNVMEAPIRIDVCMYICIQGVRAKSDMHFF